MALTDLIAEYAVPVTVYRPGVTTTVDGYRTRAPDTVINTEVHFQPMSPKELRNVPEGQNTLEWYVGWSEIELKVKDKIDMGGIAVTVQRREYWPEGPFWKVQASNVTD